MRNDLFSCCVSWVRSNKGNRLYRFEQHKVNALNSNSFDCSLNLSLSIKNIGFALSGKIGCLCVYILMSSFTINMSQRRTCVNILWLVNNNFDHTRFRMHVISKSIMYIFTANYSCLFIYTKMKLIQSICLGRYYVFIYIIMYESLYVDISDIHTVYII